MLIMRTTLTIDDNIAQTLKKLAHQSGKSFKDVVNETLRAGLATKQVPPRAKPYKIKPVSLGGVLPGLNLDKALQLAEALEDEEIVRKLQLHK
jgi:hypothetical protein